MANLLVIEKQTLSDITLLGKKVTKPEKANLIVTNTLKAVESLFETLTTDEVKLIEKMIKQKGADILYYPVASFLRYPSKEIFPDWDEVFMTLRKDYPETVTFLPIFEDIIKSKHEIKIASILNHNGFKTIVLPVPVKASRGKLKINRHYLPLMKQAVFHESCVFYMIANKEGTMYEGESKYTLFDVSSSILKLAKMSTILNKQIPDELRPFIKASLTNALHFIVQHKTVIQRMPYGRMIPFTLARKSTIEMHVISEILKHSYASIFDHSQSLDINEFLLAYKTALSKLDNPIRYISVATMFMIPFIDKFRLPKE